MTDADIKPCLYCGCEMEMTASVVHGYRVRCCSCYLAEAEAVAAYNKVCAFRELVTEMREAQRTYFRTRSVDALRWAKAMEKRVDDELSPQQELFDD